MRVIGVDEVGRGCLAGPVVAGAVLLDKPIRGLRDSKKLTKKQRETLDVTIRKKAAAFGIGWVSPAEIDEIGLTAAVALAMERAVADIIGAADSTEVSDGAGISTLDYDQLIIDGNYNFLPGHPNVQCIIKADDTVPAVSAASIIAKVARDNYMAKVAARYPGYSFEKHVGYATLAHRAALKALGACDLHRQSFAPVRELFIAPEPMTSVPAIMSSPEASGT